MRLAGWRADTGEPVEMVIEGQHIATITPVSEAPPVWLAPGLIDIHINGYGGYDINAPDVSAATITALTHVLWATGVTSFCPTVITSAPDAILRALRAITHARAADPRVAHAIPRIHVEGPFISPEDGPRGAHPPAHVRPPSLEEYHRWQAAAAGRVGLVTLAPEMPGALDFIHAVAADGVVVAIGHTGARGEEIRAAVDAGARLSTHLGNGAHARLPRHPNYLWSQLAEDRLVASFIFDGHHLPPEVMRVMLRAKGPARSLLISDAVALAGMPPGVYDTPVGGRVELHANGRLNLAGTAFLAGSASPLLRGVENAVRFTDASLSQALALATDQPARFLGLDDPPRGVLAPGALADLLVLEGDAVTRPLTPITTISQGAIVWHADPARAPSPSPRVRFGD